MCISSRCGSESEESGLTRHRLCAKNRGRCRREDSSGWKSPRSRLCISEPDIDITTHDSRHECLRYPFD